MHIRIITSIILLFLLGIGSCNRGPKDSDKINFSLNFQTPDTLVYDAINYLISHEQSNPNPKSEYILERDEMPFLFHFKHDSLSLIELDTLFSAKDLQYIFSQRNQFANFKIDQAQINNKTVIPYATFEKLGLKTYSTISYPLFNEQRTIFIIRTSYYCGALCATIGTYIYKKVDSRWILIKTLNEAIS